MSRYVAALVASAGSSFTRAMTLLPKERREAILAVYAFCRLVDDAADESANAAHALERLDYWEKEVGRIFAGTTRHPVGEALALAVRQYEIPEALFHEIIAGCRMDANGLMVAPDNETLQLYCHRVAACVGLICVRVFGCRHPGSETFAMHLGQGLQRINILRDAHEDAGRGRVYFPREWFEEMGLSKERFPHFPEFKALSIRMAEDAKRHLTLSRLSAPAEDARALRPALLMRRAYESKLEKLLSMSQ